MSRLNFRWEQGRSAASDEAAKAGSRGRGRLRGQHSTSHRGKMCRGHGPSNFHHPGSQDTQKCCRYGCGREGRCPAVGQQCQRCNKKGHFEHMCSSVREVRKDHQEVGTDEEEEFLLESVTTDNKKPWTTSLKIKGIEVHFKTDIAPDVTIINERTYEKFKNKPKLSVTCITLTMPGGRQGVSSLPRLLSKTNHSGFKWLLLARNKVGRNAAEKMSLVKRLDIHVFGKIRTSAHHHETMGTSLLCTSCTMHTISVTEEGQGKIRMHGISRHNPRSEGGYRLVCIHGPHHQAQSGSVFISKDWMRGKETTQHTTDLGWHSSRAVWRQVFHDTWHVFGVLSDTSGRRWFLVDSIHHSLQMLHFREGSHGNITGSWVFLNKNERDSNWLGRLQCYHGWHHCLWLYRRGAW